MNNNYGKLLEYSAKEYVEDPYSGYKIVRRLCTKTESARRRIDLPQESQKIKLIDSRVSYSITCESNIIPANDHYAKMIKNLQMTIYNTKINNTNEELLPTLLAQWSTTLNYTREAQESELFLQGRFDTSNSDVGELKNEIVQFTGEKVPAHRQKFAAKKWVLDNNQTIKVTAEENIKFEKQIFTWDIRAPILHGLAKQPKVLPPYCPVSIEMDLNQVKQARIKLEDHMRIKISNDDFKKLVDPYDTNLKVTEQTGECLKFEQCVCKDRGYDSLDQELVGPLNTVSTETDKNKWLLEGSFVPHKWTWTGPVYEDFGETEKIIFFKNNISDDIENPSDLMIETHLIKDPVKEESPLHVSKGVCKIPYCDYHLKTFNGDLGSKEARFWLSDGKLPHMIIFTGMPETRVFANDATTCITKTSMSHENYEIEEFTVLLDDIAIMGTPWTKPHQFYKNYLKQIGRLQNLAIAGSIDFFKFQKENWIVPIHFDEHDRLVGQLSVKIKFKNALQTTTWKAYSMSSSTYELHIDSLKRGKKFIFYLQK
jgi:hypothetical protein